MAVSVITLGASLAVPCPAEPWRAFKAFAIVLHIILRGTMTSVDRGLDALHATGYSVRFIV